MSNDMGADLQYNLTIMYYVYFLKMDNGQIYTGYTKDLRARISEHERGRVNTTSKYLPVRLIGYEAFALQSDALRREKYLKSTEGKRLFRRQYRDILEESGV